MTTDAPVSTAASLIALGWQIPELEVGSGTVQILQLEWSTQLVAAAAMVVLVALGGTLLIKNRLHNDSTGSGKPPAERQEFKTDREKVCELVDENGGRMKQSEIVNSVEWSKAKVSRLLAELEDDEEITKLRLGRENLVCLPGHEPTASKSTDSSNNS
ncbi:membrane-associated protein/domain-like protein [Halostagnicola sp. A-GB9-2]|uniref:helix-turn-helix transcriptional regulator n=1 Tax=Halostagnicola sp. A-GB9-2 TaxID=3048066 RepID=UPI0024BFAD52|nr:membrane-associated protein/domain-like protein [Halostagnicola sp. A-GB9-2]MDJ1434620.1 membrane-associated protein/domain-like protein [Halostagnicola sp. A-GB9-2]